MGQCGRTPLVCGDSDERLGLLVLSFHVDLVTQRAGLHLGHLHRLKEPLDQAASSLADTTTPEAGRDPLSFPTLQSPSLGATVFPIET